MKIFNTFFLLTLFVALGISAQKKENYITVIPGEEYNAGALYQFFFGSHWRDLWTTPIEVKVLDLENFDGGLVPIKKGGGKQTKSLRFRGKSGKIWKFRSINKNPEAVLPRELHRTIVSELLKDQVSSANPVAPLVTVPLLNAVGILQAEPKLVWLPDSELLKEFRKEYGNMLGMIEIHPDEREDGAGFAGSDKVVGTYKLFKKIENKRKNKVNSSEFLKARLMDIFLGDWDRHTDQWRWARYDESDEYRWSPVPRDRDQVFAKFTGVFPYFTTLFVQQLNHFGYEYQQAEEIAWSGRVLDRRYLTELTKHEWDSVLVYVHSRLTDEVIDSAVARMPEPYIDIAGKEIREKLISRKNLLPEFSEDYYRWINEVVELYGSAHKDYLEINRLSDSLTSAALYRMKHGEKSGEPFYYKVFDNNVTHEFRAFLLDGDDKAVIKGDVESSPIVRVIGGEGKDTFIDESRVNGWFWGFIPVPVAKEWTWFYDGGKNSEFIEGENTLVDRTKLPEPKNDVEKYEPTYKQKGHDFEFNPVIWYSSDNGFLIGGGPKLYSYNFRMDPYEYMMTLTAAYATRTGSYSIEFNSEFNSLVRSSTIKIDAQKTELAFSNYFGYGNETGYDQELYDNDYYRNAQELVEISATLESDLGQNLKSIAGFSYYYTESMVDSPELLTGARFGDYGTGDFFSMSLRLGLSRDTRDEKRNPYEGSLISLSGEIFPGLHDDVEPYYKTGFDLRKYFRTDIFTRVIFAFRAGGEAVMGGKYPYFRAVFLGGKERLRGFSRERFAGDASLFGQAETRIYLGKSGFFIPAETGVHFFAETGRVFAENERSDKWHPTFGGGIWASILDRSFNTSFSIGVSSERIGYYLRARLGF